MGSPVSIVSDQKMRELRVTRKPTTHAPLALIWLCNSFCAHFFLFDDFTCLKPNMRSGNLFYFFLSFSATKHCENIIRACVPSSFQTIHPLSGDQP